MENLASLKYDAISLQGATLSRTPAYLLPKPYRVDQGQVLLDEDPVKRDKEAIEFGLVMIEDARDVKALTQVHKCTATCFKYGKTCRFKYYHVNHTLRKDEDQDRMYLANEFRHGKKLRSRVEVVQNSGDGRRGQILPVLIHPQECDSNPFAAVLLRCNLDVQCGHRVMALHTNEDKKIAEDVIKYCLKALEVTETSPTMELLSQDLAKAAVSEVPNDANKNEQWAYSTSVQHYRARVDQMVETIVAAGYGVNGYTLKLHAPKGTRLPEHRVVKMKMEKDADEQKMETSLYKQAYAQSA